MMAIVTLKDQRKCGLVFPINFSTSLPNDTVELHCCIVLLIIEGKLLKQITAGIHSTATTITGHFNP